MRARPIVFVSAISIMTMACAGPVYRAPDNALGPYSASVTYRGLVFVAGKIGSDRGDVEFVVEAASAIDALEAELQRDGLALADCLSVTVYLTDMARYAEFNTVYATRFDPPPARACVAVQALPGGARIEIQAIAAAR